MILVTGSSGLVGSACVKYFCRKGVEVIGVDNDSRSIFFGEESSTLEVGKRLTEEFNSFKWYKTDITNKSQMKTLFAKYNFEAIIHTAAQPSHDKAAEIPSLDFSVNAVATTYLLELFRDYCPEGVFIHMSTNKVYGDNPNKIELIENETRFDFFDPNYVNGISESMSVDGTTHSLFGASKLSADIMVQEYGRYFGLKCVVLRGGCLTGPMHASAKQHGFLAYLVKEIVANAKYEIIGYSGKQVRDQIHSTDVARIIEQLIQNPGHGEVFNLGGGKSNSASILELITKIENKLKIKVETSYVEKPRIGDHICYYTDWSKLRNHLKGFELKYSLDSIVDEMVFHAQKIR
jgi:CDP-paratose 2-epimerase